MSSTSSDTIKGIKGIGYVFTFVDILVSLVFLFFVSLVLVFGISFPVIGFLATFVILSIHLYVGNGLIKFKKSVIYILGILGILIIIFHLLGNTDGKDNLLLIY